MPALTDYNIESLKALFAEWGHKPSQAARLLKHFYDRHGQIRYDDLELGRARLGGEIPLRQSEVVDRHQSADGTLKLLLGLQQGGTVETVLMPAHRPDRAAGCVSSQVGCAMGCDFCASTQSGLVRNLEAGEIVEQFLHLRHEAHRRGRRLATLVFMGIGEPMHNLPNVIEAIRRIARPGMGELGGRQITVSTVGVVPGIDELAAADLNVHLALSLHAPDDATRASLVPMTRRWGVAQIMDAARRFAATTGRIVTIEYCLLEGINDSDVQAHQLADLLGDFRAHVNLIPYNAIGPGRSGLEYRRPSPQRLEQFLAVLTERGVVAHFRRTRGDDIAAACGQLRQRAAILANRR